MMSELERLDEAIDEWSVRSEISLHRLIDAARAYRDLLANGQRVDDWPIVSRLNASQIVKLESHRHDRGLDGWMNEEPHWLLQRLREEVEELAANPSWEEAADVANFAAMFVDVSKLLSVYPKEAENGP